MDLHGIIARSSEAFRYVLDPSVELETSAHAGELAEMQRRLEEVQKKLDESDRKARKNATLIAQLHSIAQLQEQLTAQEQETQPAPEGQESRGPTPPPNRQENRPPDQGRQQGPETGAVPQASQDEESPFSRTPWHGQEDQRQREALSVIARQLATEFNL